MDDILVSVIIPTYNRASFIGNAIESVLKQTYKNIEIIVVSDNDPDTPEDKETVEALQNYIQKGIIYLHAIGNMGGSYARNRGLEIAKGEYVNFLDDDDFFYPTKIEKQISCILEKGKVAVVGCNAAIKDGKGKTLFIEKPEIYDKEDILFSELLTNLCTTSLNLIRTDVIRKSGGFFKMESSQEHLMLIRVFTIESTFETVDDVLVDIIWHDSPRISTNSKKPLGALKLTKIIEEYYPRYDEEKVEILRLYRMKQDIYAYLGLRDYKVAFRLYFKRMRKSFLDIDNLKILYMIIHSII